MYHAFNYLKDLHSTAHSLIKYEIKKYGNKINKLFVLKIGKYGKKNRKEVYLLSHPLEKTIVGFRYFH